MKCGDNSWVHGFHSRCIDRYSTQFIPPPTSRLRWWSTRCLQWFLLLLNCFQPSFLFFFLFVINRHRPLFLFLLGSSSILYYLPSMQHSLVQLFRLLFIIDIGIIQYFSQGSIRRSILFISISTSSRVFLPSRRSCTTQTTLTNIRLSFHLFCQLGHFFFFPPFIITILTIVIITLILLIIHPTRNALQNRHSTRLRRPFNIFKFLQCLHCIIQCP
mmetsp:Transcript_31388/g.53597  ORF Transcript_31388/g.53597 Transcript_31388/m.53597 type:complete len:216 (+) Transcript_31388:1374-2021(+)